MHIEIIADSGSKENIVNKSFMLTFFNPTENGILKSTNKNQWADIAIYEREDILLQSNDIEKKKFEMQLQQTMVQKMYCP